MFLTFWYRIVWGLLSRGTVALLASHYHCPPPTATPLVLRSTCAFFTILLAFCQFFKVSLLSPGECCFLFPFFGLVSGSLFLRNETALTPFNLLCCPSLPPSASCSSVLQPLQFQLPFSPHPLPPVNTQPCKFIVK